MRLIKMSLLNFRGVEEAIVPFSDGVTIIEGPNEAGKSSIAEALRLIRTMKSSSRHRDVVAIKPVGTDAGPETTVELRTGAYHLTYRKRWLRDHVTELTVHEPVPEQHSSDEAHDRYLAILNETVDVDLLIALEVVQGDSLVQPQLAQISALQRALDDSADHHTSHDELMGQIESEFARYFTASGKETGEYKKRGEELSLLEAEIASLQGRSVEMDRFTEEHLRNTNLLSELSERLTTAKTDVANNERESHKLTALKEALETSNLGLTEAHRVFTQAQTASESRNALVADLEALKSHLVQQNSKNETLSETQDAAKLKRETTQQQVTELEHTRNEAKLAAKAATAALERHRDLAEYQELTDKVKRASEAAQQRSNASATINACQIDDDTIKQLVELETEVRVSESAREAAAAVVTVHALGEQEILLDGEVLAQDDTGEALALDTVRIAVDGVLAVEVRPGTPPADLERKLTHAKQSLEDALAAGGVATIAQARTTVDSLNAAHREFDTAKTVLESIIVDTTLEALQERLAGVAARIGHEAVEEDPTVDLEELEKAVSETVLGVEEAESTLEEAFAQLEQARTQADSSREEWVRLTESLKAAQTEYDKLAERLLTERTSHDDVSLEQSVKNAETTVLEWQTKTVADQTELDAADPEAIEMLLRNAQDLLVSTESDRDAARKRVDELGALLDDRASQGIYDLIADAESAHEAAHTALQRMDRSAQSVKLLFEVMKRKREEAQQRYVAPFKERIERLGRIIFGRDFSVEVSKDLEVISRTLNGRTISFDSLSAGAREQISLLGRLASAQLVDANEGAPVILDDTLGFADPERLTSLNIVLNDVGRTAQVVLLTCQPQRFAKLGGALTVRMPG